MKKLHIALIAFMLALPAVCAAWENPIVVGTTARFTVITPGCIRMEYSASGTFVDARSLFAVNRSARWNGFTLTRAGGTTTIETPKLKLVYRADGRTFSAKNLEIIVKAATGRTRWTPGIANRHNLGGTNRTLDGVVEEVPIQNGLLSRDGWYMHDDSRRPLLTGDWQMQRPASSGTDLYFFAYGTDYKAALKDLAAISGGVPLPRKYAFGSWYSRYWPYTSDEYREIVEEYDRNDFPLDVMVMDMDWHKDGWTGWSWNRKLLPDAEELLTWFHTKNLAVTLNLHPADGVGPHEDMYGAFMREMGVDVSKHPDSVLSYDAANKKYMETLLRHTHDPLEDAGVDFWWLDWQQFEKTRGNPELNNLEWLNGLYFKQSQRKGRRGLSFSRWGGWGDHRNPIHFSGDAGSKWPMLEFEVPFTTAAGNVGCFFWSHDIGGHMGGFFPETNCRWNQFGAVSAALRVHSTRDATMDKRPWIRDSIYTVSQRIAFHLRSELFPYIYSSARRSVTEMIPLTAPMYIDHPEKDIAYEVPQEYMFGPALLAAPISSPGIGPGKVAAQHVWFPAGTWYNWFTGERYDGSEKIHSVLADINEFPLYAKAGVPVTLQHYTKRMASEPLKEVVIRTFPGTRGARTSAALYEDDGVSRAYETGNCAITAITYERAGDRHTVTVGPAQGRYDGQAASRSYVIEIPCTRPTAAATVNGVDAECTYDVRLQMNRVTTRGFSVGDRVVVTVTAADADPSVARSAAEIRRMAAVLGKGAPTGGRIDDAAMTALMEQLPAGSADKAAALMRGITVKPKIGRVEVIRGADSKTEGAFKLSIEDVFGRENTRVLDRTFTLAKGARISLPVPEQRVERLGVTTVRFLTLDYASGGKKYSVREKIAEKESAVRHWNLIGPFPFDKRQGIADAVYGPEQESVFPMEKTYASAGGAEVRWQKGVSGPEDVVDLGALVKGTDCLAYALVYLRSDRRQPVKFMASSDDGIEMFLNGTKIHSNNVMRGIDQGTDRVDAQLRNGVNTLLVKISQGAGGWAFRIRAETDIPIESSVTPFN